MADHDVEALLQEDLDLDYEVDEELQEEDLLAENDEFVLSGDDTYQENQTNEQEEETQHTNAEQEEDVLDLGVTEDSTIDELEEENDGTKKERERFHTERPTGHTPIVFSDNRQSFRQNKYAKFRNVGGRMRGIRGRGGMTRGSFNGRGNFHNERGAIHSRLGHRVPEFNGTNPNLHIVSQMEPKKVLINPHFRGNVQPTHDARLVWDPQSQQPPNQQYQQPFQNVGNFSQPMMHQQMQQHPVQHQNNNMWGGPPVWGGPPEQHYFPQHVPENNVVLVDPQFQPQPPSQLGPMFAGHNQQQMNHHRPPFRHRIPNKIMPRFHQPQMFQNPAPVYNQPIFPQNALQPYENQQPYQQQPYVHPQPNFQQFQPQTFNRVVTSIPRAPQFHRSPQKRPPIIPHDNELIKKKKMEFRNLQEVPRVDVPDTTSFIEERTPMPVEEEDEETKAYRLKIEEQRKLRLLVLKQKEERRKRAAMEQQQAEVVQGLQKVTTSTESGIMPLLQQNVQKPISERVLVSVQERLVTPVTKILKTPKAVTLKNAPKTVALKNIPKTVALKNVPKTVAKKPVVTKRVVRAIPRKITVEATSSSATEATSESGDDVLDKEHLSQFLSTRIVVPKTIIPTQVVSSSNKNGAVPTVSALLKSNLIKVSNLSASTNELKLRKMCKGVGIIQEIRMAPNLGVAVIRFKNINHAHNFYKKYQRKMVDLSLIDVQLVSPPS